MDNCSNILWVDKYRPKTLDDYVLNADIKNYFREMINRKALQHLTFSGIQGSGKTTLARILVNEFHAECLFIQCATCGNIDTLRGTVEPFCNAMTIDGHPKIVILDEVDAASGTTGNGSGFQSGLRTLIEAAQDDTKFILTCNYENKIIPAVLSRCPVIPLKFDQKDLLIYIKKILDNENIRYTHDTLKTFIQDAFRYYPDCRRIINYLQFCCNSGTLTVKLNQVMDSDKEDFLDGLIEKIFSAENILSVRQFYLSNKDKIADFVTFGSDIYNRVVDNDMVTEDGILKLTDLIYQLNLVIDKEVGLFGLITACRRYRRGDGV